jgi:hypothetical protein
MKTVDRLCRRFMDRLDSVNCPLRGEPIWNEGPDGWWAALKPGWECAANGSNSCHERTLAMLESALRGARPPVFVGKVSDSTVSEEEAMQTIDDICSGKY